MLFLAICEIKLLCEKWRGSDAYCLTHAEQQQQVLTMQSWVYIIVNEAAPGLLKVGFTDRTPIQRAYELGATGLPLPYAVAYELEVEDGRVVEQAVHISLAKYHVGKEWFRCSIETAKEAIEQIAGIPNDDSPLVPGHPLVPYFSGNRTRLFTQSQLQRSKFQQDDEDSETPLPPGHPLRGML